MECGKTYQTTVLVTDIVQKEAKNQKPFCTFTLSDGVSVETANRFSDKTQSTMETNGCYLRKICNITIECSIYNGNISFNIKAVELADENAFDIGEFIIKAPIDTQKMYDKIIEIVSGCESSIKNITLNLYEQNKEKLLYWSAAKSFHHNYYGGLLYHTYRMLSHAATITKIYKNLNRDLLINGVVLHDIGKLQELDTDDLGNTAYTVDGNLFGHLLIGIEMVNEEVLKNPEAYNLEEVKLLKHMIASHHGKQELGSIRPPATMEAIALNFIDVMDARMETCDMTYANMENGEMMDRIALGVDARLYKPNL